MALDIGGSVAIKGFNYQNAVAIFIMINNYNNTTFEIFLEHEEDINVLVDNFNILVQAKSNTQTLHKISKKNNKSVAILDKLWAKDSQGLKNRYKIACVNFSAINNVSATKGCVIPDYLYSLENIVKSSKDFNPDKIANKEKLPHTYIFITPFKDDYHIQLDYLIAAMVRNNIKVDNGLAMSIINELFNLCQSTAEIRTDKVNNEFAINKKRIDANKLKTIFDKSKNHNLLIEECKKIRVSISNNLNDILNRKIEHCIDTKIDSLINSYEKEISNKIGQFNIPEDYYEGIKLLIDKIGKTPLKEEEQYTIIIILMAKQIIKEFGIDDN